MKKPTIPTVDPEQVPAVVEFLDADDRYENWKKTYPGAWEELKEIVDMRNTALESADKTVRAQGVACGPFTVISQSTLVDANALYDAVQREEFLALGGSIQTVQQYDIDKKAFEACVAQGKVPKDIVEKVVTFRPSYNKPTKVELP
jgi:hypothetical protein